MRLIRAACVARPGRFDAEDELADCPLDLAVPVLGDEDAEGAAHGAARLAAICPQAATATVRAEAARRGDRAAGGIGLLHGAAGGTDVRAAIARRHGVRAGVFVSASVPSSRRSAVCARRDTCTLLLRGPQLQARKVFLSGPQLSCEPFGLQLLASLGDLAGQVFVSGHVYEAQVRMKRDQGQIEKPQGDIYREDDDEDH
mmetsp:Transcript_36130/g.93212  ORF Transcript_36130/g.93212 Transcript_36130/m.93212 type:complete len:200 (+) Transcript_36130:266-865(+)